jgi:hypothetical protein
MLVVYVSRMQRPYFFMLLRYFRDETFIFDAVERDIPDRGVETLAMGAGQTHLVMKCRHRKCTYDKGSILTKREGNVSPAWFTL